MDGLEWNIVQNEVERVVRKHSDVLGVLATASTVEPSLNLWLSVRDTEASFKSRRLVELGGAALLEELDSKTIVPGTAQWHNKKRMVFGGYYENPELYPDIFRRINGKDAPWRALTFEDELKYQLDGRVSTVDQIIVQAQPESLFHLRPDLSAQNNDICDDMPFPMILDDGWFGDDNEHRVLFASRESAIFPFNPKGVVLGSIMAHHINEVKNSTRKVNYGGVLLKPDAIEGRQVEIILEKINQHVSAFGGEIILRKSFDILSEEDVQVIYPLLRDRELGYAVRYLTSGPVIGVVIEAPLPISELLKSVNRIKGPRLGDRSEERLVEGRIEDGGIRDLLPLPEDEAMYRSLVESFRRRKREPGYVFTDEQYRYLARNLAHTPDNSVELSGLLSFMGFTPPSA